MTYKIQIILIIILISLALTSVNNASANDSGNIPVTFSSTKAYQQPSSVTEAYVPNWTVIRYDDANVDYISDIRVTGIGGIHLSINFIGGDFDSTQFSCSNFNSNCTGGGWFYYQNVSNEHIVKYVFDSDFVFIRSPLRLKFDRNAYYNISITGTYGNSGYSTNISRPACVGNDISTPQPCLNFGYNTTISGGTTDYYNVSYSGQSAFVNVTKGGNANTKWTLQDGSGVVYSQESNYNIINKVFPISNNNGIYANVSIETGDFSLRTINATAWSGYVLILPPSSGTGGSPSGQITYDTSSYVVGSSYGINANISSINYSGLTTYYITAYDISGTKISGFPVTFNSQNYSTGKFWSFILPGTYAAKIQYCGLLDMTCSNTLGILHDLDTATAIISSASVTYSITTDKANYAPGETMIINATSGLNGEVYLTARSIGSGIFSDIAYNMPVPQGTTIINTIIPEYAPATTYYLFLATSQSETGRVAQTSFTVAAPPNTSNTLSILWNGMFYQEFETATLLVTSNWNNSIFTITSPIGIITSVNVLKNTTYNAAVGLNEVGEWSALIVDINGNYVMRNVTVQSRNGMDQESFAQCRLKTVYVCWDKRDYIRGSTYAISFKLPLVGLNTYNPRIIITNPNGAIIYNQSLSTYRDPKTNTYIGTIGGSFTPQAQTGVYYVRMYAQNISFPGFGDPGVRAESAANVLPINGTTTTTSTVASKTNDLMASNLIAIILIMFAFVGVGYEISGTMGAVLGFGSGFIILSVLDLVPLWALFLFVIFTITAFAVFVGKQFTGGGD